MLSAEVSNIDTARTIAVIEDDVRLSNAIAEELTHAGYRVEQAGGQAAFMPLLAKGGFDLVTLDLNIDGRPYKGLDLVAPIRTARNVDLTGIF